MFMDSSVTFTQGLGVRSNDHALDDEVRAVLPHPVDYLSVTSLFTLVRD